MIIDLASRRAAAQRAIPGPALRLLNPGDPLVLKSGYVGTIDVPPDANLASAAATLAHGRKAAAAAGTYRRATDGRHDNMLFEVKGCFGELIVRQFLTAHCAMRGLAVNFSALLADEPDRNADVLFFDEVSDVAGPISAELKTSSDLVATISDRHDNFMQCNANALRRYAEAHVGLLLFVHVVSTTRAHLYAASPREVATWELTADKKWAPFGPVYRLPVAGNLPQPSCQ